MVVILVTTLEAIYVVIENKLDKWLSTHIVERYTAIKNNEWTKGFYLYEYLS